MNCKPGDMAIVTSSRANAGKTVTCVRLMPDGAALTTRADGASFYAAAAGPIWFIDRPLVWDHVCEDLPYAPDKYLMPIRPDADGLHVRESDEVTA